MSVGLARRRGRALFLATVCLLILVGLVRSGLLAEPATPAPSTGIVISQIYGGGGNSGATLRNDFIELFNLGNATVDVSSWSVQYTSAAGSTWQVTSLCASGNTCTIAPGHYFLVQEAQGAGGSANLPTPDAIGAIPMSATNGKVALVNSPTALSGSCPLGASVIDFLGYGTASCFEGSASSAANNTTAKLRINGGCTDTDSNNADFLSTSPNPRNSGTAGISCGASPSPSPTPTPSPSPGCGVERWSVKTGTDPDAGLVDLSKPEPTTITTMRSWTPPGTIPLNNRVAPYETTVWTVNATLVQYKLEDDSDYHVVIRDDAGNTIVTEIPYPGCVGAGSPFAAAIANARAKFNDVFTPNQFFQFTSVPVQITGVAMFDFLHGQTGGAPNGIELHPVLDITFTSPTPAVQLSATNYPVSENVGSATITVTRTGELSASSSVNYTTSDTAGAANCGAPSTGVASSRCDYTSMTGSVQFGPGETSKTFTIPIIDDVYSEGDESFTVTLSNPVGATLGSPNRATVTISDNGDNSGANPIDMTDFFVRQNYIDFLSREPDTNGYNFWRNQINSCGANAACIDIKRTNVSAAFFVSVEFQNSGYLVERLYRVAYGTAMGTANGGPQFEVPIVRFEEFLPDTQAIGRGVVVNDPGWEALLENNKQALIEEFVQRPRFTTAFPSNMTAAQFVDKLSAQAGAGVLSTAERDQLVSDLTTEAKTRAQVLRAVAEDQDLYNAEFNRAFVLMEFFGYLRRNPDDLQDTDYTGYDFWLKKLNAANGDYIKSEMVRSFLVSSEYRRRFGTP